MFNVKILIRRLFLARIIYVIWGNVVRAYSVQTGELLRDYEGLIDNIVAVHFHPYNSKLLIACSESGEIGFWKWKSGIYHNKIVIMEFINIMIIITLILSYLSIYLVFTLNE